MTDTELKAIIDKGSAQISKLAKALSDDNNLIEIVPKDLESKPITITKGVKNECQQGRIYKYN